MGKNKTRAARKKIIFGFIFQFKIFFVSFLRFLNIVCFDQIHFSHSFYKKNLHISVLVS